MRGEKKGPRKCFKTLTERLTPKYVCPSKGKGGVTALSSMGTRPERAQELEDAGETRKPPKQQRELEGDPIAELERREKVREQRYLNRMRNHPQSMHADEEQEATHKTPSTIHYEVDEEAKAVKKSLGQALVEAQLVSPFSSIRKSLQMATDLNKAELSQTIKDVQDAVDRFMEQHDIKSGETFKNYFKRKKIDTKAIDKFVKKTDPMSPTAFTSKGSRDTFMNTPIDKMYKLYASGSKKSKEVPISMGPLVASTKFNPIEVTLSHYNNYSGNSASKGSLAQKFKKEQQSRLKDFSSKLKMPDVKGASIRADRTTPTQRKQGALKTKAYNVRQKQIAGHRAQLGLGAAPRLDMTTEEGRAKKIEGMLLALEGATWLLPTSAGARIAGGGAKLFAGPSRKALATIGNKLVGPENAWARKKFATVLTAAMIAATTPAGRASLNASVQAAAKGGNAAQIMNLMQKTAAGGAKALPKVASGGGKAAKKATKVARTAKTAQTATSPASTGLTSAQATAALTGVGGTQLASTLSSSKASEVGGKTKAPTDKKDTSPTSETQTDKDVQETQQAQQQQQQAQQQQQQEATQSPKRGRGGRNRPARSGRRKKPPVEITAADSKKKPSQRRRPAVVERGEDRDKDRAQSQRAAQRAAKEAAKQVAARLQQDRYSTVGERGKQKFAQVVRKSVTTMADYAELYKSKSYLNPILRQVKNKNISLKEALDSVPWHMQAELLELMTKNG